jgi:hypothetical protein
MISYSNKLIEKISKILNLNENQQNNISSLFLMIIKNKSFMKYLFEKNIDFIILCCIYSIIKNNFEEEKNEKKLNKEKEDKLKEENLYFNNSNNNFLFLQIQEIIKR